MLVRADLGGGRTLYAGHRGERWTYDVTRGALEAAVPAPEDLVAILRSGENDRWFVGRSGTVYRTTSPLGPFVEALSPFDPIVRVSGAGGTLVAVARTRKLLRSADHGHSWVPVGPSDVKFVDVAIDEAGNALALASPEAFYASSDAGERWRPLGQAPQGALAVGRSGGEGGLEVYGVLGALSLSPAGQVPFAPVVPATADPLPKGGTAPLGADAGALAEGRAVLGQDRYLEVRLEDENDRRHQLVSGPLAGPLALGPLPSATGCRNVRLGAFGRFAYLACFRSGPSGSQPVELSRSDDGGRSFHPASPEFYAKVSDLRMSVGKDGTLLVSGACQPSTEGPGCAPAGILKRRPATVRPGAAAKQKPAPDAFEFGAAAAPSLAESALDLSYDADGKTAFAVGMSTKSSNVALFVSTDDGKTFEPREVADSSVDADSGAKAGMLSPGADGTMALVLATARSATLLVFDGRGDLLRAGAPPERSLIGGAGLSVLAIGAESGTVWESLDGGASFQDRGRAPLTLCPGDASCDVPIRCSTSGCVVGAELTRVGWGAAEETELEAAAPLEEAPPGVERRLKAPIACLLDGQPWRLLHGASDLPDAANTALGDVAWFTVAVDQDRASASTYHAHGGARPRVDTVSVLAPAKDPNGLAFMAIPQIEGLAAVRYRVPISGAKTPRLTDVEIAWDNLLEGRVVRQRLLDGGEYVPGDFERGTGRAQLARPDLVSIGERGIYLRLHHKVREKQPTLFLDGARVTTLPAITWPAGVPREHLEMAHVGAEHVGLSLMGRNGALVRARREGENWTFEAAAIGLPDPEAFGELGRMGIAYARGQAVLHVEEIAEFAQSGAARVFPLRASGPVVGAPQSVPTQADLPPVPHPCRSEVKLESARIVARAFPGARHPVVVSDAVEPPRSLITGASVLYGSAQAPCAASFELDHVTVAGMEPPAERGVVLLDDLEHAWLLRQVKEPNTERVGVEYRTMSCRFDPKLEVPEEILKAPEALAPRR